MTIADLPAINAGLNATTTGLLLAAYFFIRHGRKIAHRNCMIAAVLTSTLFLTSYLIYHARAGHTVFRDPAWFRPTYLALLMTHTILAAAVVPLVAITLGRAWRGRFERHKAIARWTWPIWIYVSLTGVLIYLLLYWIFPQPKGLISDSPARRDISFTGSPPDTSVTIMSGIIVRRAAAKNAGPAGRSRRS